jgi:hypothetical protein
MGRPIVTSLLYGIGGDPSGYNLKELIDAGAYGWARSACADPLSH